MSQDWSKYLAKGLPIPPGGTIPVRQDVRDLSKEQLYLYLEGLKRFQTFPSTDDPLSYYQIAGIHGRPFQTWPAWNKDIPEQPSTGKDWFRGFCTHTSIIFLTWHRPYLALFESTLQKHVSDIASGIDDQHPDKKQYLALAESFRIPYWDWARKDTQIVPEQALDPNFRVDGPPSSASVPADYNPLYQYPFPEVTPPNITLDFPTTVRYPESNHPEDDLLTEMKRLYSSPAAVSSLPKLIPERNLTERTAWVLQRYNTYAAVSNNFFRTGSVVNDAANWGSLEDIHNAIHNLVGGDGHMAQIAVSAFDPIFWLHHTNIDRLFAIWQALHEDDQNLETFVTPRKNGFGSFSVKRFEEESIETKLYPFRPNINEWYTSKDVKRTEKFGYSYPETRGLNYPPSPAEKNALRITIGKIYEPFSKTIRQSLKHKETAGVNILPQSHVLKELTKNDLPATAHQLESLVKQLPSSQTLLKESLKPGKPLLRDLAPNHKYLEWLTNIKAEKHTLDGAYTVHIFLGPPDENNVALWPASPNHVGTFSPLGQTNTTACGKCQEDQKDGTEITGQIPLTIALAERYLAGLIPDLSEAAVVPFLTEHLHWRVAKSDGRILDNRSAVNRLLVFVVSSEVTLPEDDNEFPVYASDVKIYPEITTNAEGKGRGEGTGLTEKDYAREK